MVVEFANIVAGLIPPTCLFLLRWGLLFTCFDIDGKLSGKVMSVTLLCTRDCFFYSPKKSFAFLLSYERKNENIHITRLMENQVIRYHSFGRNIIQCTKFSPRIEPVATSGWSDSHSSQLIYLNYIYYIQFCQAVSKGRQLAKHVTIVLEYGWVGFCSFSPKFGNTALPAPAYHWRYLGLSFSGLQDTVTGEPLALALAFLYRDSNNKLI